LWLSYLCPLIYPTPKNFKLFGFPIFFLCAYLMKVQPVVCRADLTRYLVLIYIHPNLLWCYNQNVDSFAFNKIIVQAEKYIHFKRWWSKIHHYHQNKQLALTSNHWTQQKYHDIFPDLSLDRQTHVVGLNLFVESQLGLDNKNPT
jgi:hypothetical protein